MPFLSFLLSFSLSFSLSLNKEFFFLKENLGVIWDWCQGILFSILFSIKYSVFIIHYSIFRMAWMNDMDEKKGNEKTKKTFRESWICVLWLFFFSTSCVVFPSPSGGFWLLKIKGGRRDEGGVTCEDWWSTLASQFNFSSHLHLTSSPCLPLYPSPRKPSEFLSLNRRLRGYFQLGLGWARLWRKRGV